MFVAQSTGTLCIKDYHYTHRIKYDLDLLLHRNALEGDKNINLWGLSLVAKEKTNDECCKLTAI